MRRSILIIWIILLRVCLIRVVCKRLSLELLNDVITPKMYSKQTGHSGDSLIIGSATNRIKPKESYRCSKLKPAIFKETYGIEVLKHLDHSQRSSAAERPQVDISQYFVYTKQEVWSCTNGSQGSSFLRVINELISIKEIYEVKYYYGVEISLVNYGYERSVKVSEIKYVEEKGDKLDVLELYGNVPVILEEDEMIPQAIPNLSELYMSQPGNPYTPTKDVKFRAKGEAINSIRISEKGRTLRIGSSWEKHKQLSNSFAHQCRIELGISPPLFKPECFQLHSFGNSRNISAKISDRDFPKLFTIVKRRVWICYSAKLIPVFYRVLNEVIGRVPIKKVAYEDGIIALSSINIRDGKSVRYTEVNYFDVTFNNHLNHEVHFQLMKEEASHSYCKTGSKTFIDMEYKLLGKIAPQYGILKVYRTLINPEGYDLRVGSQAMYSLKPETSELICRIKEESHNTEFKVKLIEDGVFHSMVSIVDDWKFFVYLSQRTWKCSSDEVTVIRVVNKLKVYLKVHEIETFDGVDIKEIRRSYLGSNTVEITETKFMDQSNRILKFEGTITFARGDECSNIRKYKNAREFVRKSEEEVVPYYGTPMTVSFGDNVQNRRQLGYNKLIVGGGQNSMNFSVVPEKHMGGREFVAVCHLISEYPKKIFPTFEIMNSELKSLEAMNDYRDNATYLKYFDNELSEVWNCAKETNDDLPFLRVVNRQCMKKQVPNKIGEIHYSGMDEIWIESMDDAYDVRTKSIRYLDKSDYGLIDFSGFLWLEEKNHIGSWLSGTEDLSTDEKRSKLLSLKTLETKYNLDRERRYTFNYIKQKDLNVQYLTMVIGSKWQKVYGTKETTIKCISDDTISINNPNTRKFLTRFQVNENENDNNHNYLFDDYAEAFILKVWNCYDTVGLTQILRVFNRFRVKIQAERRIVKYLYYDGVTFSKAEYFETIRQNPVRSFIQIDEEKYLNQAGNVMKFEGNVEFLKNDYISLKFGSTLSRTISITDVKYILNENEIHKTNVGEEGLILEVGQEKYKNTFTALETIRSDIKLTSRLKMCKITSDPSNKTKFIPKVTLLRSGSPTTIDKDIENYFELEQKFWKCKDEMNSAIKLLRVVNELKVKPNHPVAHIYHYDGVIVHTSGGVRIKETKYYYIHQYKIIKLLDSLLELNKDVQLDKNNDQVINYFLDTKILNYINPNTDGEGTFEIHSTWERTIRNDDDSIRVSCSKEENGRLSSTIDTDIFTMISNDGGKSNKWQKMEILQLSTIVEYTAQEVSQCMENKKLIFYKVVKKMIMRDTFKPRRIYYPAGVSVQTIVFPNGKVALQITQVKFLDPRTKGLINYVGKLAEAENIVEKLFRMNSESKEEQREVLQGDAKSTNKNWPLDTLRFFALTNSASQEYIRDKVTYSEKRFNTWIVNTGLKILQIGTPWEAELLATRGEMKCLLDKYNTDLKNTERYFPKVVEYIDDKLYELDEVGFHSNFAITNTEVWICTNSVNTFIRVVSFLEVKKPIYAIRYADGVSVNTRKNSDGIEVVQIKEIIYLSASTSKALKYDGDLKIVKPSTNTKVVRAPKWNKAISAVLQCFGVNTGN